MKKREKLLTMFASFWIKFTYLCLRQVYRVFPLFISDIWPIWGLVIVKNKLTPVFHVSVLLLMINCVITLSKFKHSLARLSGLCVPVTQPPKPERSRFRVHTRWGLRLTNLTSCSDFLKVLRSCKSLPRALRTQVWSSQIIDHKGKRRFVFLESETQKWSIVRI